MVSAAAALAETANARINTNIQVSPPPPLFPEEERRKEGEHTGKRKIKAGNLQITITGLLYVRVLLRNALGGPGNLNSTPKSPINEVNKSEGE